MFLCKDFTKFL